MADIQLVGLSLRVGTSPYRSDDYPYSLSIELNNQSYSELFDALIGDVARVASAAAGESDAAKAVLSRLHLWQRFLRQVSPDGLGPEEQRGLYGELWVLLDIIAPGIGMAAAVLAWTGPAGADQDFQHGGFAGEVKTTTQHQPQTIRITSERQLDLTGIQRFVLFQLSIDVRQGSGESLPEIVDRARSLAGADGAIGSLEERLIQAGYHDIHRGQYERRGFTVRNIYSFHVTDRFPRIVEADLPESIGEVHYSIATSGCVNYRVTDAGVRQLLNGTPSGQ
jgi:hypothetical protein